VNVYFLINNLKAGDSIEVHWFDPTNVYKWYTPWSAVPNDGYSSRCYWADLNIARFIAPSFGTWTAQIYVNSNPVGSKITFQVTDTIQPRGPNYSGSFDPIATDCSHLGGWALDGNNPSTSISVDFSVSGFPLVHATANLARSDLTGSLANHAWNYFNLQPYEDGQTHTVHVYYGGTTQDLPGSPRVFPPAGYQLSACVVTQSISVTWASGKQPPATSSSGQAITVGWNVSGPATQSRVIYSSNGSPNTSNPQYSTPWLAGGNVTQQAQITLPVVSSTTAFTFQVQAQASGQDYLSSTAQSAVSPATASGITLLFDATKAMPSSFLGSTSPGQVTIQSYVDSGGMAHTYHVFSVIDNVSFFGNSSGLNHSLFRLSIRPEGAGSVLTLSVPSGGDKSDTQSGGSLQFLIPFGLTVNAISGANAGFGNPKSKVAGAFSCAFGVLADEALGAVFGAYYTGYQILQCTGVLAIPQAGDLCSAVYPIINDVSTQCLNDPGSGALYGDRILNTHQIRNIRWKPAVNGLSQSDILFHFDQSPPQVLSLIQQKGTTIYLNTPRGDFWLDNFR